MRALGLVVVYLIGSIPVGFLITRVAGGFDIRGKGSGTIGATNVLRTLGPVPAVLTLLGDVAKGYVAVRAAEVLGPEPRWGAAGAVLAIVGNCWPVFLRFKGGKGVATGLGAFLALAPKAILPAVAAWIVLAAAFRYVSLASIVACVAMADRRVALRLSAGSTRPRRRCAAALIVWRHQRQPEAAPVGHGATPGGAGAGRMTGERRARWRSSERAAGARRSPSSSAGAAGPCGSGLATPRSPPPSAATRENARYLPGVRLPDSVARHRRSRRGAPGSDLVIVAVPSHFVRGVLAADGGRDCPGAAVLLSATKGLEPGARSACPSSSPSSSPGHAVAALSGPSFAREVALGKPTALVVASADAGVARSAPGAPDRSRLPALHEPRRRRRRDRRRAEERDGDRHRRSPTDSGLGENARAALITRGLAEIGRLARAPGRPAATLAGLAGLGDLVLTCTGRQSRNHRLGLAVAQGQTLAEAEASTRMVAEGVRTVASARALAGRAGVEHADLRRGLGGALRGASP